jgi:hypothetical protein
MSKFDNVLNKYITEAGTSPIQISPPDQTAIQKAPKPVQNATAKIAQAVMGAPNSEGDKALHYLATNPDCKTIEDAIQKSNANPDTAKKDLLGYGINIQGNQTTPETTPTTEKKPTTTPVPTSSTGTQAGSTPASEPAYSTGTPVG